MAEKRRPTILERKFMQAYQDPHYFYLTNHARQFEEVFDFFYGTLVDPSTLARVPNRPDTPEV